MRTVAGRARALPQRAATYIAATLLALVSSTPLRATMLIVVYTPDGYWIRADSARQAGGKRIETVCKVHETSVVCY